MASPFDSPDIAEAYAQSRPPLHRTIVRRAFASLGLTWFERALDIGCGSGISTGALAGLAGKCIGIDPVESMVRWAPSVAPEAEFVAGSAEALPFGDRTVDLITAAGSLNYFDLTLFFGEAARILRPSGIIVIYDFSPGRTFPDSAALDEWFTEFTTRYPSPLNEARDISPEILEQLDCGFRVMSHEHLETAVMLAPEFYAAYMMSETNVAYAVRNGTPRDEISSWCAETLLPVWRGRERDMLFSGYFTCMQLRLQTEPRP